MPRWMIDFDSVLSNTFKHQIERVNQKFGILLSHEDFTDWDVNKVLNEEQASFMWGDQVFLNDDFQRECTAVPHAVETVSWFLGQGHECVVVSDRPQALYDATRDWLDIRGLTIPLYLTRSVVSKSDQDASIPTKQDVVRELNLTRIVDDAPHHAEAFSTMPDIDVVYLMDTPSNQHVWQHHSIVRVFGWDEIYQTEQRIAALARLGVFV